MDRSIDPTGGLPRQGNAMQRTRRGSEEEVKDHRPTGREGPAMWSSPESPIACLHAKNGEPPHAAVASRDTDKPVA